MAWEALEGAIRRQTFSFTPQGLLKGQAEVALRFLALEDVVIAELNPELDALRADGAVERARRLATMDAERAAEIAEEMRVARTMFPVPSAEDEPSGPSAQA
jgi:hypothetical protein